MGLNRIQYRRIFQNSPGGSGGGGVAGSGTLNYLSKWTPDTTTLGDSEVYEESGLVGIGVNSGLAAKLGIISTTEQLRAGYDASNYFSTTVANNGLTTFDAVGSGAGFQFLDQVYNYGAGAVNSNTAFGKDALIANLTATGNSAFGVQSLLNNTTGIENVAIGYDALVTNIGGGQNVAVGYQALRLSTSNGQIGIGYRAAYQNAGYHNTSVGYVALQSNTSGNQNTVLGFAAGNTNVSGSLNVFLGYTAGYYETGSNKLFIDNATRANEADGRVNSMIYGVFGASASAQTLDFNAATLTQRYDSSNYYSTTVSSAGLVTLDATGSGAAFNFNDNVGINTPSPGNLLTLTSRTTDSTVFNLGATNLAVGTHYVADVYAVAADNSQLYAIRGRAKSVFAGNGNTEAIGVFGQSAELGYFNYGVRGEGLNGSGASYGVVGVIRTGATTVSSFGTAAGSFQNASSNSPINYAVQASNSSTSSSSTAYGVYSYMTESAAVSTAIGLRVDMSGSAGTQYAILATGGSSGFGTTTPSSKAILELSSTTKGFLVPRMTGAQADAITSVPEGLILYCTDTSGSTVNAVGLWIYKASTWTQVI